MNDNREPFPHLRYFLEGSDEERISLGNNWSKLWSPSVTIAAGYSTQHTHSKPGSSIPAMSYLHWHNKWNYSILLVTEVNWKIRRPNIQQIKECQLSGHGSVAEHLHHVIESQFPVIIETKLGSKITCLEPIALASLLEIGLKCLLHLLLVFRCLAGADEEGKQAEKKQEYLVSIQKFFWFANISELLIPQTRRKDICSPEKEAVVSKREGEANNERQKCTRGWKRLPLKIKVRCLVSTELAHSIKPSSWACIFSYTTPNQPDDPMRQQWRGQQ